jgi:hypothetical protein
MQQGIENCYLGLLGAETTFLLLKYLVFQTPWKM